MKGLNFTPDLSHYASRNENFVLVSHYASSASFPIESFAVALSASDIGLICDGEWAIFRLVATKETGRKQTS